MLIQHLDIIFGNNADVMLSNRNGRILLFLSNREHFNTLTNGKHVFLDKRFTGSYYVCTEVIGVAEVLISKEEYEEYD